MILTFHGDPATSRAVTWRTDTTITKGVAEIAIATVNSGFEETAKAYKAQTEVFDLGLYKGNNSLKVHYHSVVFEGCSPIPFMLIALAMALVFGRSGYSSRPPRMVMPQRNSFILGMPRTMYSPIGRALSEWPIKRHPMLLLWCTPGI